MTLWYKYIYILARAQYRSVISVYLYPYSPSNIYIEASHFCGSKYNVFCPFFFIIVLLFWPFFSTWLVTFTNIVVISLGWTCQDLGLGFFAVLHGIKQHVTHLYQAYYLSGLLLKHVNLQLIQHIDTWVSPASSAVYQMLLDQFNVDYSLERVAASSWIICFDVREGLSLQVIITPVVSMHCITWIGVLI